jgi:hypothetical protein
LFVPSGHTVVTDPPTRKPRYVNGYGPYRVLSEAKVKLRKRHRYPA